MAKFKTSTHVAIDFSATITLNEAEVRALDGMFGYGPDAFLKGFYKQCGKNYVQPFESGVRSLHESVASQARQAISEIDELRRKLK